jgi:hypothetical protein
MRSLPASHYSNKVHITNKLAEAIFSGSSPSFTSACKTHAPNQSHESIAISLAVQLVLTTQLLETRRVNKQIALNAIAKCQDGYGERGMQEVWDEAWEEWHEEWRVRGVMRDEKRGAGKVEVSPVAAVAVSAVAAPAVVGAQGAKVEAVKAEGVKTRGGKATEIVKGGSGGKAGNTGSAGNKNGSQKRKDKKIRDAKEKAELEKEGLDARKKTYRNGGVNVKYQFSIEYAEKKAMEKKAKQEKEANAKKAAEKATAEKQKGEGEKGEGADKER